MVFIKIIDEADFGCEGVPGDAIITDRVVFIVDGKEVAADIPESIIFGFDLDENTEISSELYYKIMSMLDKKDEI